MSHVDCAVEQPESAHESEKKLLNRVYLTMLVGRGLDAAIVDVLDIDLVNTVKAAEVLLNRKLYAHSFLKV